MRILQRYSWPGNIRELCNALTYAAVNSGYGYIKPEHIPPHILEETTIASLPASVKPHQKVFSDQPLLSAHVSAPSQSANTGGAASERQTLCDAIRVFGGNLSNVARHLGMSRTTLYARLKKYNISRKLYGGPRDNYSDI